MSENAPQFSGRLLESPTGLVRARTAVNGLIHRAPTRYYSDTIEIGFWEALRRFLKYRKWSWSKVVWTPVYEDDPRYGAAPYEEAIIELPQ